MVIKDRFDVPFLDELRSLPDVSYYRIGENNRDEMYESLSAIVKEWR